MCADFDCSVSLQMFFLTEEYQYLVFSFNTNQGFSVFLLNPQLPYKKMEYKNSTGEGENVESSS